MLYYRYEHGNWQFIIIHEEGLVKAIQFATHENIKVIEEGAEYEEDKEGCKEVINQLDHYFEGKQIIFDVPLDLGGTPFQQKVWRQLMEIPFGETVSYKDIAVKLGNEKASRAVGMANNRNNIPIIIPCHRVIGANGKLVGYAGGLDLKERLLHFEKMIDMYHRLDQVYGEEKWWPVNTVYEMMVGAILTQNTNWTNVEKAIANIGDRLTPEVIENMPIEELAESIRPSGYYNQKAERLKVLTNWFKQYDYNVEKVKEKEGEKLREELLAIKGIGRETADDILVYALGKPYFIIDAYTRRLFERVGFIVPKDYDEFRVMIETVLPQDVEMYANYHGLIVEVCKAHCMKVPQCERCPLEDICEKK